MNHTDKTKNIYIDCGTHLSQGLIEFYKMFKFYKMALIKIS